MRLSKKEILSESYKRHDLEIDGTHNFIVSGVVVHNSNNRTAAIYTDEGPILVAGSHTTRKTYPAEISNDMESEAVKKNVHWFPMSLEPVRNLLLGVLNTSQDGRLRRCCVILYGEVYGRVQSLKYGIPNKIGYRAFDLCIDGRYVDRDEFLNTCQKYGVETVPMIYRGPYSMAKVKEIADGKSVIPGADNIREGVVIRPVKERTDPKIGRCILKAISTEYELSKHKDQDTTDV